MSTSTRMLTTALVLALALTACNLPQASPTPSPDPNAVFTAAAQTVVAQLTRQAPLATNTPLPVPTPTATATATPLPPSPTPLCDLAEYVRDVTVPDGTQYGPGAKFTKTWRLRNAGTCNWTTGYQLYFDTGDQMGGAASTALKGSVAPGQEVDLSVELTAPLDDGTYRGYWRLRNPSGNPLPVLGGYQGKSFFVEIKVKFVFAVTGVTFHVARDPVGSCAPGSKYVILADIAANGAGPVTYQWVRSDGTAVPAQTLTFAVAGTKTVPYEWLTTDTGLTIAVLISAPNNQTFGPVTLTCP